MSTTDHRNDTRRRTTRSLDLPFTLGNIGCQVDFWNSDERTDPLADGITTDTIMGIVSMFACRAVSDFNADVVKRRRIDRAPSGSTKYITTKSVTIGNKSARVKLKLNVHVDVPTPVLMHHTERVLTRVTSHIVDTLDPEGFPSALAEVAEWMELMTEETEPFGHHHGRMH